MNEVPHYTQGIASDGAAILRDGVPITIDEVVKLLNEREIYFNTAVELHKLLDDIDSCSDVFKPELTSYVEKVNELSMNRHDYFTTDGYSLFDIETQRELIKIATNTGNRPKYYRERNPIRIIVVVEDGIAHTVYTNEQRIPFDVDVLDHDSEIYDDEKEDRDRLVEECCALRSIY